MFIRKPIQQPLQLWCRCISSAPLPPQNEWRAAFPIARQVSRVFLRNPELSKRLANAFLKDEPNGKENTSSGGGGKIVIEAFPGPGMLTRSLLDLPESKLKKLIVLESTQDYLKYLTPLAACDPRVVIVPLSGFDWTTYKEIEARGLLDDVVKKDWTDERPNLHFVSHIPNSTLGDQVVAQFFRLIPERSWLFKYGRVPMSLIIADGLHNRARALPSSQAYCKVSVIAQAVSEIEEAIPTKDLSPYNNYFYPPTGLQGEKRTANRPAGTPNAAINVWPLAKSRMEQGMLDKWDYVLRRLFVLRGTPMKRAMNSLAPGALNLLHVLTDANLPEEQRLDVNKKVRDLTVDEWALVVKAFDEWPFAPEDLAISDSIYNDVERS
ncbi:hypothetical protein EW145_g1765 [Phellinidium pouzarii]|uniref:rRNA adenine N(6)-methyltransferase n=1 Tax=Phellinidium pouzarii TaxID=167371 RepID=A0A4S4LDT6_9AGAM|nr:hypothetical protein EW145_g1765 [Phellinidium pouzarii]